MNETILYSKIPIRKDFEGAPKGAFEIIYALTFYSKFGKKLPSNLKISDLCNELNDIDTYIIEMALKIHIKKVTHNNKPYHPIVLVNTAKKLARQIKKQPLPKEESITPKLGKAI